MYRRLNEQPVGLSDGIFSSIFNAVKGVVSGIKITAPPINLPQISFPPTYQIPGTYPPTSQTQMQASGSATPDWLMPVALGGIGLLAVMMLTQRGRR